MSKAIIELSTLDDVFERTMAAAKRIDVGVNLPETDYYLSFPDAAKLFAELTGERFRLLDELKSSGAQSIYALAKRLGRNYSNVHRDVQALLAYDLISKDADKHIYVPWDAIEVRVTLGVKQAA